MYAYMNEWYMQEYYDIWSTLMEIVHTMFIPII